MSRSQKNGIRIPGFACANLLETGIRPSIDILSFEAFENAITVLNAVGGDATNWHTPSIGH